MIAGRTSEDSCFLIGYEKVINDGQIELRMQTLAIERMKL